MKKIVVLIGVLVILLSVTVFAGDVPESLLSEDGAKVFIGKVSDFTLNTTDSGAKIENVVVIPTEKIKGDVEIGVIETYERCDSILNIVKGKEYLFGYVDENNFYIYEIKSRKENGIKLVNSEKYDMTKRLENYLNEGAFAIAEEERLTLGQQMNFVEFLFEKPSLASSGVSKVTLRYQDDLCEINKDEFFKIAEAIMITNVKNDVLYDVKKNPDSEDAYKTVLYIELLDDNDKCLYFGAVSRFGEVDRYGLFMGRLMAKDYEMKREDLEKLYSLFPHDVKKEIKLPGGFPSEAPLEISGLPEVNYKNFIIGTSLSVFLIAFVIGFLIFKKKGK